MVRREAFESAGAFDERFFLFFEEHDLFRRIREKGWDIYYVPGTEIQHYFEESFRNSSIDVGAVYMKSAFFYYRKYYGLPGHFFIKWLLLLNRFLLFLEPALLRRKKPYREIHPKGGFLNITWPLREGAVRYLVEVSYWTTFSDRAGMYAGDEDLSLREELLERLPNGTGFLKISPVYDSGLTGTAIDVIRISRQPESGP